MPLSKLSSQNCPTSAFDVPRKSAGLHHVFRLPQGPVDFSGCRDARDQARMRHLILAVVLLGCASNPSTSAGVSASPKAPLPEKIEDLVGKPAPHFSLPSARDQ